MKLLEGKVAIITGASRGIGRSIALAYAQQGAKVVLTGRTETDLMKLEAEIRKDLHATAIAVPGTVLQADDVKKTIERALGEFQRIDALVNNAGIPGPAKPLEQVSEAEWDDVMGTNVKGVFLFSREVLPQMLNQHSGNIINISSGAGEKQQLNRRIRSMPYVVSKFAVEGLNHALAVGLLGTGINVNALKPGVIRTAFHAATPAGYLQEMERRTGVQEPEVVNPLAIYLAALKPGELTGASLSVSEWNKSHPEGPSPA